MKRIYFVRHGESVCNVARTVQSLEDPLSEEGERQALRVAERAQYIDFSLLISSDAVRAQNTAKAISEVTQISIVTSVLFREIGVPTSLVGKKLEGEEFKAYVEERKKHTDDLLWKYADEESFIEVKRRAQDSLKFLTERPEEEIMVVTHGHFLRFLIAMIILGDDLTLLEWEKFSYKFGITNTGITVVYRDTPKIGIVEEMWRILTWNDHAHFAE